MLLCLEDTVLLERDRAFLGEDGSFSWLPMASGHRRVHTRGSELSCHSPGAGTHCGEGEPGQGPLCGGPRLGTPLPAALHAHKHTNIPTAQPCCPPPRATEGSRGGGEAEPSPARPPPAPPRSVGAHVRAERCPRASVSPGGAEGSSRSRKLCPVPPRPAPPYRARTEGPESGPHPTAARRVPLLSPPSPHGSPSDTGQQQPRPRPRAEGMRTVRGSPRRPAAAAPMSLR